MVNVIVLALWRYMICLWSRTYLVLENKHLTGYTVIYSHIQSYTVRSVLNDDRVEKKNLSVLQVCIMDSNVKSNFQYTSSDIERSGILLQWLFKTVPAVSDVISKL